MSYRSGSPRNVQLGAAAPARRGGGDRIGNVHDAPSDLGLEKDARQKLKERMACHAMHSHPQVYASEASTKNILHNTFSATDYFHHFPEEKRRPFDEVRLGVSAMGPSDSWQGDMAGTVRSVGDTSSAWFPHRRRPATLKLLLKEGGDPSEDRLRFAFQEIDVSNRGEITRKELLWALRRCGVNVKAETLDMVLECMDKEKGEGLSEDDFVQFFEQLREISGKTQSLASYIMSILVRIFGALLTVALFILLLIFARMDEGKEPGLYSIFRILIIGTSVILGSMICVLVAAPAVMVLGSRWAARFQGWVTFTTKMRAQAVDYVETRQRTKVHEPAKIKQPIKTSHPTPPARSYRDVAQAMRGGPTVWESPVESFTLSEQMQQPPAMASAVVQAPTRAKPSRLDAGDPTDAKVFVAYDPMNYTQAKGLSPTNAYMPTITCQQLRTAGSGAEFVPSPYATYMKPD